MTDFQNSVKCFVDRFGLKQAQLTFEAPKYAIVRWMNGENEPVAYIQRLVLEEISKKI